eukprot:scaffold39032_cov70-Cyclotella_meneghiniana.AAC.4
MMLDFKVKAELTLKVLGILGRELIADQKKIGWIVDMINTNTMLVPVSDSPVSDCDIYMFD